MLKTTIAEAIVALDDLLKALNDAYWDVNDINTKDCLFDVITTLHEESNELAKLSIEDHSMPYEPITIGLRAACKKFNLINESADTWFIRTTTAEKVRESLPKVASLISSECLVG